MVQVLCPLPLLAKLVAFVGGNACLFMHVDLKGLRFQEPNPWPFYYFYASNLYIMVTGSFIRHTLTLGMHIYKVLGVITAETGVLSSAPACPH